MGQSYPTYRRTWDQSITIEVANLLKTLFSSGALFAIPFMTKSEGKFKDIFTTNPSNGLPVKVTYDYFVVHRKGSMGNYTITFWIKDLKNGKRQLKVAFNQGTTQHTFGGKCEKEQSKQIHPQMVIAETSPSTKYDHEAFDIEKIIKTNSWKNFIDVVTKELVEK